VESLGEKIHFQTKLLPMDNYQPTTNATNIIGYFLIVMTTFTILACCTIPKHDKDD
jgi:hypothetical protein